MKKRHLLVIPLLFLTFLLFSTRKEEPPPIHGSVIIRSANPDGLMPAVQMAFQTVQQESEGSVLVTPSPPVSAGSLYVHTDRSNGVDSGIALFNASDWDAVVHMRFIAAETGDTTELDPVIIPPGHKYARVLSQLLLERNLEKFEGQLNFTADRPVHVLGLLTSSDKIYNLPVIDQSPLPDSVEPAQLAFPHFAFGGGYRCTLMLWNPTDESLSCDIFLLTPEGDPAQGLLGEKADALLQVDLRPGESRRIFLGPVEAE
jgi:hypothetical protein